MILAWGERWTLLHMHLLCRLWVFGASWCLLGGTTALVAGAALGLGLSSLGSDLARPSAASIGDQMDRASSSILDRPSVRTANGVSCPSTPSLGVFSTPGLRLGPGRLPSTSTVTVGKLRKTPR